MISAIHLDRQTAEDLASHFAAISKHVPLRPVRSEGEYDAAVASLNALLDAGAAEEAHPLAELAATLGELIGGYDEGRTATDPLPGPVLTQVI